MKRYLFLLPALFLLCLFSSISLFAQSPEAMAYQAEARDSKGHTIKNKNLEVKITILVDEPDGTTVWEGHHDVTTDNFGLFNLNIGEGVGSGYIFADIDWAHHTHFLNVRVNYKNIWSDMGTTQFLSVPYALHAETARSAINDNVDDADADPYNELQDWSNLPGIPVGIADGDDVDDADASSINELQNLTLEDDILKLSLTNNQVSLGHYVSHWRLWGDDLLQFTGAVDIGDEYTKGPALRVDGNITVGKRGENPGTYGIGGPSTESGLSITGGISGGGQIYLYGPEHISHPGEVHLRTGGYERILINPDGNVGVGTSTPNSKLDVYGDINFTGALKQNGNLFDNSDADADPLNEIQQLSITDNKLTISNGNTVSLPASGNGSVPVFTSAEIAALSPSIGDAVFNITENLYQVYDGTSWQIFNTNCWPQPSVADAGTHQYFNNGTNTTTLSANMPESGHGTGEWNIIRGEGGSISNTSDPNTTFSGLLSEVYTLRWTISTSCSSSASELTVLFDINGGDNYSLDIDGNVYKTVWIGEQLWMAENLKVTKFNDGTSIPNVTDNYLWGEGNNQAPAYCWYENDPSSYNEFGALYNGFTVFSTSNGGKNVCPAGWHVPSKTDWTELEIYLQNSGYNYDGTIDTDQDRETNNKIAKALASKTNWSASDIEGVPGNTDYEIYRNKSGFTALPVGQRGVSVFDGFGSYAIFWSAFYSAGDSYSWRIFIYNDQVSTVQGECQIGYLMGSSIRCVKD